MRILKYAIWNSNFAGAVLLGADMQHRDCSGSLCSQEHFLKRIWHLPILINADLAQTDFTGTNFEGATLVEQISRAQNLQSAQNITLEQLLSAQLLRGALLDDALFMQQLQNKAAFAGRGGITDMR